MKTAIISDISEIIMGQAPIGESYNDDGNGVPLIAGATDFGELTPNTSRYTSSPTKISKRGDIIICVRATIGDLNWSDKEYCLGRGVASLRINATKANPLYIWRVIEANKDKLTSLGRGATFKQITKSDLSEFSILLRVCSIKCVNGIFA